jgi:hypothetical protein
MSGVAHLVEHRRLDFRPVTADISAELANYEPSCRKNAPLT